MEKNILFWFRNDLRLLDNQALFEASKKGKVIPVYVFIESNTRKNNLGFERMGEKRAQFLVESVNSLKKDLQNMGSDLIVKIGEPGKILLELSRKYKCSEVFASKAVTQEDTNMEAELSLLLKPENIDLTLIWNSTLYHVRDLPFQVSALPTVYSEFRKQIERRTKVREPLDIVSAESFFSKTSIDKTDNLSQEKIGFKKVKIIYNGGEKEGQKRLDEFVWKSNGLKNYNKTRNNLDGENYSSKLSAWLSLGCISARTVYEQIKLFELKNGASQSTDDFKMELIWRDYFQFIALKFGIRLFKQSGIKHDMNKSWREEETDFNAWKTGNTGIPFIDSCMRELNTTGYISNRARQNACSFLVKDLNVTWWWGARYFEHALIDYDVCSNWGNWNYIAGIGTDPKEGRYINPLRQAEKYDPNGDYVRKWVPELANLPTEELNKPWENSKIIESNSYPKPIKDLEKQTSKKKEL